MTGDVPTEREALQSEIEQTRAGLGETVEELAGRLDVKAQAAAAVNSAVNSATGAVSAAAGTVSSAAGAVAGTAVGGIRGWGARTVSAVRALPAAVRRRLRRRP